MRLSGLGVSFIPPLELGELPRRNVLEEAPRRFDPSLLAPPVLALLGAPSVLASPSTATDAQALVTRPQMLTRLAELAKDGVSSAELGQLQGLLADPSLTPGARDAVRVLLSKSGHASVEAGRTSSLELTKQVDAHTRGAYFRKVSSPARAEYRGIQATARLPELRFDPARQFVSPQGLDHFQTGPLDRPSIYLGGRTGGKEMDVGLTWDRVYDGSHATYTDRAEGSDGRDPAHRFTRGQQDGQAAIFDGNGAVVAKGQAEVDAKLATLKPNFAFRPVWRAISGGKNEWGTPKLGSPENVYFYPGEKVDMKVEVVGKNKVTLSLSGAGQSMSHTFSQDGAGVGKPQSFKRVSSIDQFYVRPDGSRKGREGLDALPTKTVALGGGWDSAELLRTGHDPIALRGKGMTEVRGADTAPSYDSIFHRYNLNVRGGERVDIIPPR